MKASLFADVITAIIISIVEVSSSYSYSNYIFNQMETF